MTSLRTLLVAGLFAMAAVPALAQSSDYTQFDYSWDDPSERSEPEPAAPAAGDFPDDGLGTGWVLMTSYRVGGSRGGAGMTSFSVASKDVCTGLAHEIIRGISAGVRVLCMNTRDGQIFITRAR